MANPLFIMQMVKQIQDFQKTFTGDAKAQVEQMMKDGRLSQEQFNRFAQQADEITQFMAMMPKQ